MCVLHTQTHVRWFLEFAGWKAGRQEARPGALALPSSGWNVVNKANDSLSRQLLPHHLDLLRPLVFISLPSFCDFSLLPTQTGNFLIARPALHFPYPNSQPRSTQG